MDLVFEHLGVMKKSAPNDERVHLGGVPPEWFVVASLDGCAQIPIGPLTGDLLKAVGELVTERRANA